MKIRDILVILPSNLGDVLLTLPSLSLVRESFPEGLIVCLSSPHTEDFVKSISFVDKVILYKKTAKMGDKIALIRKLRLRFDACLDFKHSAIPVLIGAKLRSALFRFSKSRHKKDEYLSLTKQTFKIDKESLIRPDFYITSERQRYFSERVPENSVFICPGSLSSIKRYPAESFSLVLEKLKGDFHVVVTGSNSDRDTNREILNGFSSVDNITDLTGQTSFLELAFIFKKYARAVICGDSAPLHLASLLDIPVLALFGPTDPSVYGPYGKYSVVARNDTIDCIGCMESVCKNRDILKCMKELPSQRVLKLFYGLLAGVPKA